jgi:vacuolar-type H+-ATPase subunit I/STV1
MPVSNFETELKDYYEAKRRSHLTRQIDEVAEFMRETLLLCDVYDVLFDEPLIPGSDIQEKVRRLRSHVQNNEFDAIEENLPATLESLEDERDEVRSVLQKDLHDIEDRIGGFEALNERIEKIDSDRINDLKSELESLDQVSSKKEAEYDKLEMQIRESATEFAEKLEAVENAIFEDFRGSDIETMVQSLLRGKSLRMSERDSNELVALQESKLGPYVNLSLEGEDS